MTKNSSENRIAWTFAPLISHICWEEKTMGLGKGTLIYWTNLRPAAGTASVSLAAAGGAWQKASRCIPCWPILLLKMLKNGRIYSGWCFGTWNFMFPIILGMSSSQLTKSYFSEELKPPTSIYVDQKASLLLRGWVQMCWTYQWCQRNLHNTGSHQRGKLNNMRAYVFLVLSTSSRTLKPRLRPGFAKHKEHQQYIMYTYERKCCLPIRYTFTS